MIEINLINTLIVLITCPILFLAYYTLVILNLKRKYRHLPGPEAKGMSGFFFGFSKDIGECYAKGEPFEEKLIEWQNIYGPVFKIHLGSEIKVFTADKNSLKEIFFTKKFPFPEKSYRSFMFPYNIRTFGNGLSTEFNYDKWHHRRMILNQGFNRNILMSMMTQFNVKIDLLMEKLSKQAFENKSISFSEELNQTIFDLISLVLFSIDEDVDNTNMDQTTSFTKLVSEVLEISFRHFVDKFAELSPFKIKDRLRLKKLTKLLRQKPRELIMERMKNLDNNTKDLLNLIIEACKGLENDDELLMELMIDDFFTFFTGGVDSSVRLLKSCIKFLEKNTNVLEKAKKEIEEVIGSRTQINYDDLGKLKYCSSIVKETLRIEPVNASLSRNIDSDFTICGLNIPKGTDIWVSSYVSGRMESHFQNPNEFKPERFMTDTDSMDTRIDPFTYFPFGLGPRGCIAKTFVHIQSVTLLAKLLQRFDFKMDQSNASYEPHYILTSRE